MTEDAQQKQETIIFIDPTELRIHPAAADMPEWGNDDPRLLTLVDDIAARGIDQALIITDDNRVMDGRHRLKAAKRLKLEQVPCIVRDESEVSLLIINSLLQRRHYTKGQRAYLAAPLLAGAFEERHKKRLTNLKSGVEDPRSTLSVLREKTSEELADALGIGRALFQQAVRIHDTFAKNPDWREIDEPKILDEEHPVGLGALIAGFAGRETTKGKPKADSDEDLQLDLFQTSLAGLTKQFTYWGKLSEDQRKSALPDIRKTVAEMPQDLRKLYAKEIKRAEKSVKKISREGAREKIVEAS